MLIACAGDAHGRKAQMEKLADQLPKVDAFCFLGDCDQDALYLQYALAEKQPEAAFYAVAGNNDPFSKLAGTLELRFENTRALLTHGHLFRVKLTLRPLAERARARGCDVALFGHTHRPYDAYESGVRLVNPGALMDGRWALMETGEPLAIQLLVL